MTMAGEHLNLYVLGGVSGVFGRPIQLHGIFAGNMSPFLLCGQMGISVSKTS